MISMLALLCLSPFFLLLAVLIRLESRGNIIYRQIRVGKDGRHFYFYKFRSMFDKADQQKRMLMAQNESSGRSDF